MEANQPQIRYRVNVSRTTKGAYSWDCTVEMVWAVEPGIDLLPLRANVLAESDALKEALNARYPLEKP